MILLIINNVIVFTGIGSVLAVLLVIADHFLANYGDCRISINDGKKELQIKGGNSLLNSLAENSVFIPSACGGKGTCGLCKVKVISGGGPLLPTEKPYLDENERGKGVRLSCQVKVKEDVSISIPQSLFAIKKFAGIVTKIIDYTYDIKGVFIKLAEPDEIDFKAGQYVQLESKKYPKVREIVSRAYSIASPPSEKRMIELIIRFVPDGIMTTYIHHHLKEKDEIFFTGPYGDFYLRDNKKDMIFVAGGSGMAPFKSILDEMKLKGTDRRIVYLFGAREEKDLFLTEEMEAFEKELPDFTFIPVLSQADNDSNWTGRRGYIPPLLKEFLQDAENTEGYLCGSPGLLAVAEKEMKKLGIKDVYYDSFG